MFVFHGNDFGVVALFWIAVLAIIFVVSFFRYRERTSRYRAIETLAEKGHQIPPDMLNGRYRDRYNGSPIWSGVTLMCCGIAIFIFFWAMTGGGNYFNGEMPNWLPFVGIFPFMIGLARLLAGIFDRPRER